MPGMWELLGNGFLSALQPFNLAMVVIGLIIGSFVSLNEGREHHTLGPLAQAINLSERKAA